MTTKQNPQGIGNLDAHDVKHLKKLCPRGTLIYSLTRHVARSGMSRNIAFYVVYRGRIVRLTSDFAGLTGHRLAKHEDGLVRQGVGVNHGSVVIDLINQLLGYNPDDLKHEQL